MANQKLPMKALMHALSEAAVYANEMLSRDYAETNTQNKDKKQEIMLSEPLCVTSMRVSFSAYVAEAEQMASENGGRDILLDFNGPSNNFNGEIVFQAYSPDAVCTSGAMDTPCGGMTERFDCGDADNAAEHCTEKHYYI